MRLGPRLLGRLGVADGVTAANAAVGLLAVLVAGGDPGLAARLILLGAIADGLDGVVARKFGTSDVGRYLDSLADVATFCVAPAVVVVHAVGGGVARTPAALAVLAVAVCYVIAGVVRLGIYTAYDGGNGYTEGVPSTLAATVLGAAVLAGATPSALALAAGGFAYLMLTGVEYPDLFARDALAMGILQGLVVLAPGAFGGVLPVALLVAALAYLLFAPRFYWRD